MANLISGLGGSSSFDEEQVNQYKRYDITSIFQDARTTEADTPTEPIYELVDYGPNDDIAAVQHSGITSKGIGDDTYVIAAATVSPNANITITDASGSNTLQFIQGLDVTEAKVANDSLLLTLANDAVITLLGASHFNYVIGGNPFTAEPGTVYNFADFVENILGTQVPTSGVNNSTGFQVTTTNSTDGGTPDDGNSQQPDSDANVINTGLSNAQIHSDIQNFKEYINGQHRDNFRAQAEADLQNGGDGITPISSLDSDFEAQVLAYDADDVETEFELIEANPSNFDSDYISKMISYGQPYTIFSSPLKAIYDDVIYTDMDHMVVAGNDSDRQFILDITDNKSDLLIYSKHNDFTSITGFEADQTFYYNNGGISHIEYIEPGDDLYLGDVAMHVLTRYDALSNALNWITANASSFVSDKADALIFQDGANAVIWIENDASNTISSATSSDDFNVIEMVGINADELTFNDGFIQLQEL